jgi:hypothetical protein
LRFNFIDGAPGYNVKVKDCGRYWAGTGGGASSNNGTTLSNRCNGGDMGPFTGGIEGTRVAGSSTGGAGGGASAFGNGGNGGDGNQNAPAVPSGSYGAGGGGSGGYVTTGFLSDGWSGAFGGDGYVSLHYFIITP